MEDLRASARGQLYRYILDADYRSAIELLHREAERSGSGVVLSELIHPTLAQVGERFVCDKLSLAQVYFAGKIVEDFVSSFAGETPGAGLGADGRIAVIGNAEDDYHDVGRRMVGAYLVMAGWKVEDLGNDVLASRFVDSAVETGASVIGVSSMMLDNALNIAHIRRELDARGLAGKVKLAVGGAIFVSRPDLVAEVGGDGTCANAMEVPSLFERLLAETRPPS